MFFRSLYFVSVYIDKYNYLKNNLCMYVLFEYFDNCFWIIFVKDFCYFLD